MNAEGEMEVGDDQAPVKAGDDVSMKEVVAAELSDDIGKWEVSDHGGVSMREASVGAELNVQERVLISTGDYPRIEDHGMDVVLMNGSVDTCTSGRSFGSVGEETNLAKEAIEIGGLDRYVMECSPGRDEFVVNEVDCLKDQPLEVFEAEDEFGFEQRAENEETEFENFVRAEEAYEASRAPGALGYIAEGEGLHFQQLLVDSEAEGNSNLLHYNRVHVMEPAGSSGVSIEAEVGLFYGQGFEGSGRKNSSHQSVELDQGLRSSQVVRRNQALATSSYAEEGKGGSQVEPSTRGSLNQCLLRSIEGTNESDLEETGGTRQDVLLSAVGATHDDEPIPDRTINPSEVLAPLCPEEVSLVSKPVEIMDRRVSSQGVIGVGDDSTDTPDHVLFHREVVTEGQPFERSVAPINSSGGEPGEAVQTVGGFPDVERDFADDSSHFPAVVKGMDVSDHPVGQGGGAFGVSGYVAPQVPHSYVGYVSSVNSDGATKGNEIIEQVAESPLHYVVQSNLKFDPGDHHPHSTKQPDNDQQGTSSKVACDTEALTRNYEALANDCISATPKPEVDESGGVVLERRVVVMIDTVIMRHEPSLPVLAGEATVEHELVAAGTESLDNVFHQDEPLGKAYVEHGLGSSEQQVLRRAEPAGENCNVGLTAEIQGILPRFEQNSDNSAQICDLVGHSGPNPEEYRPGGSKEVVSESDVNNGTSEDVRNVYVNPQSCEGTLRGEPVPANFEALSHEPAVDTCQLLTDSNGAETLTCVCTEPPDIKQNTVFCKDSQCPQSREKGFDGRKEYSVTGADVCEVRNEIQPAHKSVEEVENGQPVLLTGAEGREVFHVVNNFEVLVTGGQSGVPAVSAIPATGAFKSAERRPMLMIEDKIRTSQNDLPLMHARRGDNDSHHRGQLKELLSVTKQIKVDADSAESEGIRRGGDDVKSKSPQQETIGVPLWVKWRGKWQPGIQCSSIDCPPATLKAKPSYSKKHYTVVYSPTARNYSWVDIQHTCPITEDPLPLFSGTHESGRDTVKDVFITRRRMLLKLGGEMLDISDRLHVKAVVEGARNVNVWKSFASEAAAATTYAELGSLLVSLHLAIVRDFIKPAWMTKRYALWKEECVRAESASTVQKLTKELINAVLWDDVGPLWNEPDQPELDPQWSNWKGEAFEEKEEPDNDAEDKFVGPSEKDEAPEKYSSVGGSKRFKEQARARRRRPQSPEASESTPLKRSKHSPRDSEEPNVDRAITAFRSPLVHPSGMLESQPYVPVLEADRCHEVISGDTLSSLNEQVTPSNNEALTQSMGSGEASLQLASCSTNYRSDDSEGDESKVFERIGKSGAGSMAEGLIALESGLCSAYLKNKSRRCNRFAKKEGVKYCEKHIYLLDPESAGKTLASEGNVAWQSGLCSAFLRRENRRCARQAKEGFKGYCGFHVHLSTNDNDRNGEAIDVLKGEEGVAGCSGNSVKDDRCQGITTRGVQCTHRTKDGSSFCVKHSLKGASQVERYESKGQPSGASRMDWQKGTEPGISSGTSGQADEVDTHHDVAAELGTREGTVRTLELKSFEHSRGSEGSTRKRKALSSFFTDRAAGDPRSLTPPSQDALSPKFTDMKAHQWTQCKGRTTRNEEQCSFRAREGQDYCSKHLNAVEAKKKITFQRSLRKDEVINSDTKGLGARKLLHRFIKGIGGICSPSWGADAENQLVQSTTLEAGRDGTAAELVKLVTVEMTKLQMFLQPLDVVEGQKADVNPGVGPADSYSLSIPKASQGPEGNREPYSLAGLLAGEHRLLDDRPVICGLCDAGFLGVPDLGKHWQLVHKKEVNLFVKGHACRVCDRLYTRKQTVMTHWRKRHQSVSMTNPDLSVCFACDLRYADDDFLLEHVVAMHPYQLSSPALKEMIAQNRAIIGAEQEGIETLKCPDCSEEFDTHLSLYQHCEKLHRRSGSDGICVKLSSPGDMKPGGSVEAASQNGKYVCRLCGMTFPMLPDLGRHHQAAHMLCNKAYPVTGSAPGKKEASFESGRMKLPIRRKADDKAGASEPSYGPTRRRKKKKRFTSQKKSYERDTRGPDSLRFHVQAVLQGATHRKRHKKQLDDPSSELAGKHSSPLTHSDFILPRESLSNSSISSLNDGILSLAVTGPTSLSLTRRVESNFESVQEKFKIQADKIFTNFSQLHGETSVKHESQVDGHLSPVYSGKPGNPSRGILKQEHDLEASKDVESERSKFLSSSNDSQEQLTVGEKRRQNFIVTCDDLSGGLEPVPIVCVIDQDVLIQLRTLSNKESGGKDVYQPSSFTYITKRRLDPSLGLVPENYKIGCTCGKAQCTPDACEHVNLFDCDNAEACDIYGKPMRARFPYDDQGCIILEEGYLVYECNSSCQCRQTCHNRVLQKGVTVKLEVFKTQYKGWAVRAAEKIIRGTFVCEYVGEVLHDQEANKRGERYDQVGCSYLYDIDAHLDITGTGRRSKPFVIDATSQGNVARFINHSCAPNLVNYQVLVESMDAQLAHIGLFASRDIEVGEELAYDYRYRLLPGKGCPCHCGAKNCRGRLY